MREKFRVDLRGLVDVLSHHLYSSERIYLRELVQTLIIHGVGWLALSVVVGDLHLR
jgi:hypothetical protein